MNKTDQIDADAIFPPRKPTLFEAIDWERVANSLEQATIEYAAAALNGRTVEGARTHATAALVTDALARAIWEGLE